MSHPVGALRRLRRRRRTIRREARRLGLEAWWREAGFREYRREIRSYWRHHFGRPVHPLWHLACARACGTKDVRFVPKDAWHAEILPFFNDFSLRPAFLDKNLTELFLDAPRMPSTIVKRMHGRYYAGDHAPLSSQEALDRIAGVRADLIVKPSRTDGGYGVRRLSWRGRELALDDRSCSWDELESIYGRDFIVQERIEQHPVLAQVHPQSVNTVRMVTLRWEDEIRVLAAFARFGTRGRLTDNAGTGGVCCAIDEHGKLIDSAIDATGALYPVHPTTGYPFANRLEVPGYEGVRELVIALHRQLFHFDLVSWDIAIGRRGEPILLEVNFRGSVALYQFACRRPLFGDLTERVLEAVRDAR